MKELINLDHKKTTRTSGDIDELKKDLDQYQKQLEVAKKNKSSNLQMKQLVINTIQKDINRVRTEIKTLEQKNQALLDQVELEYFKEHPDLLEQEISRLEKDLIRLDLLNLDTEKSLDSAKTNDQFNQFQNFLEQAHKNKISMERRLEKLQNLAKE